MVTTQHPSVVAMRSFWARCRDVYAGQDAVHDAGTRYLPQPSGMDPIDYGHYRNRAAFLPVFSRTVAALAGTLLRKPPQIAAPDWLRDQLADVTMADESLTIVARTIAHDVLTVGRFGILVDMLPEAASRPYWTPYQAEDIVNWRTRRIGSDPAVLTQLVLRETATVVNEDNAFAHNHVLRYRECGLDDEGTYRVRTWTRTAPAHLTNPDAEHWTATDWITPTRRGTPLNRIPFVFINATDNTPNISRPPLLDLADVNLSHYRNSADREHALYFVAIPTPWVAGPNPDDQPLRIGPATAWKLAENGRAGMLEFTGAGIAAIERAMQEKEQAMASLGARMLDFPLANETATAVAIRHGGDVAALQTIASSIGAGLTTLARIHDWWARGVGDVDLAVRIDVADDLDRIRISAEDVKAALLAVQSGLMAFPTFYALLERAGWSRPGIDAASEGHLIAAAMRSASLGDDE